jgi:hypothetical protein
MPNEVRHQRANDGTCLGGHCVNREALQPSVWHDPVLLSVLEQCILLFIVFLIEHKVSTLPAPGFLALNDNFISFEAGSELEQVLVAVNVGTDVRDEGDAGFGQQVDNIDLVAQLIECFG